MAYLLIRRLERYTRLSSEDKALLMRVAAQRVRSFSAKTDILPEGARPENIFLVRSGWVARYKMLEDGRRQIVALLLPGDLCDLNAFVLQNTDHSLIALTPVKCAEITRAAYEELMQGSGRLRQALWWGYLTAIATDREWVVNLGQRSAFERLAHFFCEIFARLEVIGQTAGNTCEMPLNQAEIGEVAGLSGVHVNRTLQELRASKLLGLQRKRLVIHDMAKLRSVALFDAAYLHLGHEGAHLDAQNVGISNCNGPI